MYGERTQREAPERLSSVYKLWMYIRTRIPAGEVVCAGNRNTEYYVRKADALVCVRDAQAIRECSELRDGEVPFQWL